MNDAPKPLVAVLNDQEWTARGLETILEATGYRTVRAFTAGQLFGLLGSVLPSAFILDQQLPDRSGLEVATALRNDPRFGPSTPIIMTTAGPSGRQARLAAYEAGAWDFFGQPLDGEALLAKLRLYIPAREAYCAMAARVEELDARLYPADGLVRRARELVTNARRRAAPLACVAVGMAEGMTGSTEHAVGEMMVELCRGGDVVGRMGPGRFAVIAGDADSDGAGRLASRLAAGLERIGIANGHRIGVSGVTADILTGDALLAQASAALAA
jgi:PleD family two-component response regulator